MVGRCGGHEAYIVEEKLGGADNSGVVGGFGLKEGLKPLEWKGFLSGTYPVEWQPRVTKFWVKTVWVREGNKKLYPHKRPPTP